LTVSNIQSIRDRWSLIALRLIATFGSYHESVCVYVSPLVAYLLCQVI